MAQISIEMHQTAEKLPPKGVPVIVSGGVAMLKTGNEWMPTWWMKIPTEN